VTQPRGRATRATRGARASRASAAAPAGPELVVLGDADEVAEAAAERTMNLLRDAIASRGRADIALTGGSTAVGLYSRIARSPARGDVSWDRVHLWWGDERVVPSDHPASNAGLAYVTLLNTQAHIGQSGQGEVATDVDAGVGPGVPVLSPHIHPFPVDEAIAQGRGGEWAAAHYAELLRSELAPGADDLPAFDLILLGVGGDGHILSVFPESAAFLRDAPLVLAVPAPTHIEPHLPRLTLSPRLLEAAGRVLVMSHGSGKADVLADVFGPTWDPVRWPAQLARRANATWLLDRSAAARLGPR
jgi:6-phosphogluconolactonase